MTQTDEASGRGGLFAGPLADIDGMNAVLAANWWAIGLRGVIAILFGLVALLLTSSALLTLVLVFGAYMIMDGVFAAIAALKAARRHQRWLLLVFEALVNLAAGGFAFALPGVTAIAFVFVVAGWALVTGVLAVVAAFRLKHEMGRIWMILGGAASIVFSVVLALSPLLGAVVLTWWLGAYALAFGISQLVLADRLRVHKDDARAAALAAV